MRMPDRDPLSDQALARVALEAWASESRDTSMTWESANERERAYFRAEAAAVRDHILAALAAEAGDEGNLLVAFLEAQKSGTLDGIRAVAARVAAQYAAEVLALREALKDLTDFIGTRISPSWLPGTTTDELASLQHAAMDILDRPLPDAVRRVEAEARLGRAAARLARQERWTHPFTDDEYDAALDALRALDQGVGGA